MSTGPNDESVPTTECRVCETDVPAGEFCGLCGCHLTPRRGEGPDWLRWRNYGAAPGEPLLLPSLASSLFPHLPQRSRTPFRVGLAVVLLALVAFALLRLPAPLIAVAALGLPLLFLIYLQESDARRDLPAPEQLAPDILQHVADLHDDDQESDQKHVTALVAWDGQAEQRWNMGDAEDANHQRPLHLGNADQEMIGVAPEC